MGWESGVIHNYAGLLAVHLLAKDANYFFFIDQENDEIIFKLEPFDREKLETTNELCMKLPLNHITNQSSVNILKFSDLSLF